MVTKIGMVTFFGAYALNFIGLPYMAVIAAIAAAVTAIALVVEK